MMSAWYAPPMLKYLIFKDSMRGWRRLIATLSSIFYKTKEVLIMAFENNQVKVPVLTSAIFRQWGNEPDAKEIIVE